MFFEISQNSQENACARVSSLIKLQAACNIIKKETLPQVFSSEFSKFRGTPFFTEHLWWLLLNVQWILKSLEEIFRAMQKYVLILHTFSQFILEFNCNKPSNKTICKGVLNYFLLSLSEVIVRYVSQLHKYFEPEFFPILSQKTKQSEIPWSSPPEVSLGKVVLKICSKITGEHPCRSVISKQLYWNHTSTWMFSCKNATYFQNTFS